MTVESPHVLIHASGVALLNKPDAKPRSRAPPTVQVDTDIDNRNTLTHPTRTQQPQLQQRRATNPNPAANPPNPLAARDPYARLSPRAAELMRKMQEDAEEVQLVQLGDASIAAPFTSKSLAVTPIAHIIRQVKLINQMADDD
jgi:cation-transporting ATPase 13A1